MPAYDVEPPSGGLADRAEADVLSLPLSLSLTDEPARRRKVRLRLERCWELLQLEEERKPTVRRI